jgi:S1-C subfamily serine protease
MKRGSIQYSSADPERRKMKTENIWYGSSSVYKMVKHLIMVMCLIFLLSACASTQQAQRKQDASQPLTCSKGPDCEAKWDRALIWVRNNAASTVDTANESIINVHIPQNSSSAIFTITKTETDPGTYIINFRAGCSSMLGCTPSILELKASFANYVMKSIDLLPTDGSQKSKAQSDKGIVRPRAKLGAVTVKTSQTAANKLGMQEPKGTRIIYIEPGAAFDSGLHLDDIILKFAEQTINDEQELDSALEKTVPPKTTPITIWRAGVGELVISVRF